MFGALDISGPRGQAVRCSLFACRFILQHINSDKAIKARAYWHSNPPYPVIARTTAEPSSATKELVEKLQAAGDQPNPEDLLQRLAESYSSNSPSSSPPT